MGRVIELLHIRQPIILNKFGDIRVVTEVVFHKLIIQRWCSAFDETNQNQALNSRSRFIPNRLQWFLALLLGNVYKAKQYWSDYWVIILCLREHLSHRLQRYLAERFSTVYPFDHDLKQTFPVPN